MSNVPLFDFGIKLEALDRVGMPNLIVAWSNGRSSTPDRRSPWLLQLIRYKSKELSRRGNTRGCFDIYRLRRQRH